MALTIEQLLGPKLFITIDRSNATANRYVSNLFDNIPVRVFQILPGSIFWLTIWDAPNVPNEVTSYGMGGSPDLKLSAWDSANVGHQMPVVYDFGPSGIAFALVSLSINHFTVGDPLACVTIFYLYES